MNDDDSRAIRRIEHRLAVACGQTRRVEAGMLLSIAEYINDLAIYGGWHELIDKYLKLRDQYTGQYILAPYILIDLSRREHQEERVYLLPNGEKLISKSLT